MKRPKPLTEIALALTRLVDENRALREQLNAMAQRVVEAQTRNQQYARELQAANNEETPDAEA